MEDFAFLNTTQIAGYIQRMERQLRRNPRRIMDMDFFDLRDYATKLHKERSFREMERHSYA